MGIIPSRNLESQRREKDGIVYYDRGTLPGKNGRRYESKGNGTAIGRNVK